MKSNEQDGEQCKKMHSKKYDAYYATVLLSVGLKDAFDASEPCSFKVNEPTMHTATSKEVHPDAIFQCDNDTKGIVCEIKSSLPQDKEMLLRDIKEQICKYAEIEKGWMTNTGKIQEHSILLLVRKTDANRARALIPKNTGDTHGPVTNFCLGHWEQVKTKDRNAPDMMRLGRETGSTGCKYFDRRLDNDIEMPVEATMTRYEKRKFVKADPPDLYMLTIIYQNILPEFIGDDGCITVTIADLERRLVKYYTSWSGLPGEQSQIRTRWIVHALKTLHRVKLAKKIHDGKYRIDPLPRKKNVKDFLLDKLCSKNTSSVQTGLYDF